MTHLLLLGSLKVGGRRKGRKFPGTDERRISTEGRDWSRKEKERKKVTRTPLSRTSYEEGGDFEEKK